MRRLYMIKNWELCILLTILHLALIKTLKNGFLKDCKKKEQLKFDPNRDQASYI